MKKLIIAISMAAMMVLAPCTKASAKKFTPVPDLNEKIEKVNDALENIQNIDSLVNTTEVFSDREYRVKQNEYKLKQFRHFSELAIVVLGILIGPMMIIGIVIIVQRGKRKRMLDRYQMIEFLVKSNYKLPENMLYNDIEHPESYRRLRSSLIWIAIGIGLAIFSCLCHGKEMVGISMIPTFIGIANLTVCLVARHDAKLKQDDPDDDAQQD